MPQKSHPAPRVVYGTPRKLPKPPTLKGRVAVLDIAFAAGSRRMSYEKITRPFIEALGSRLAVWIDHHDHSMHAAHAGDRRFVLRTKAEHPACPEMVTAERIAAAGPVDTVLCHTDFDGLCSAAKWVREGEEPYPGADADARIIDTRLGKPGALAEAIDRALRARQTDNAIRDLIVDFLAEGARDEQAHDAIRRAADGLLPLEERARAIARDYEVRGRVALARVPQGGAAYDKTELLMLGQQRAPIAVVADRGTVTVAAAFDSGIDLLKLLDLPGGMPTVVSVPANRLDQVLATLGWKAG
jgi:hypothetical protein